MTTFPFQNPNNPAPEAVLRKQRVLTVQHYTFDEAVATGEIIIHEILASDIKDFFSQAFALTFPIKSIIPVHNQKYLWNDNASCADNNTSGFNFRHTPDGSKISLHGQGLAFDINPLQNPYIKYENNAEVFRIPKESTYDKLTSGTLYASHPLVIFMKERGWTWGGDWTPESGRVDYQHFEKEI